MFFFLNKFYSFFFMSAVYLFVLANHGVSAHTQQGALFFFTYYFHKLLFCFRFFCFFISSPTGHTNTHILCAFIASRLAIIRDSFVCIQLSILNSKYLQFLSYSIK